MPKPPCFVADSSVSPTGLKWAVDPVADVITTAGDLIYGTAADTVARLGIGTAGQVLQVNSGATAPEWGAAGGASFSGCSIYITSSQSVSNAVFHTLTFNAEDFDTDGYHSTATNTDRITIPSGKNGKFLVVTQVTYDNNNSGERVTLIDKNGTQIGAYRGITNNTNSNSRSNSFIVDLVATDYLSLRIYQSSGGSLNLLSSATGWGNYVTFFGVQYLGA